MKLLTFYSDSHKELYEKFFLESYNKFLKGSFELKDKHISQVCKSGDYGSDGFSNAMLEKINHIIDNIDLNDPQPLVFADCDIQFFGDFKGDIIDELGDYDIKFQDDVVCACAGFFVCKQNDRVLSFFNVVRDNLIRVMSQKIDDQQVINSLLNSAYKNGQNLKHGLLSHKYFTVAQSFGAKQWNGEDFNVPSDILVHHGNWTLGMDNKFKVMNYVKNKLRDDN